MMTVIDGLTGSGKTFLMTRLLLKARKQGDNIYANLNLNFPNDNEGVYRWHALSETFNLTQGTLGIDEGQKLFSSRNWLNLPVSFADKIASSRHEFLNIITTTQDFGHIDIIVRNNIHERYSCRSIFRFPKREKFKPIIQIIRIIHKQRSFDDVAGIKWAKSGSKFKLLSKYWTRELYDTHANINLSHFVCLIKRDKKKWLITLTSRQLSGNHR